MAENDVKYLSNNNIDCEIEKDGVFQRASLSVVIPPGGSMDVNIQDLPTEQIRLFLGEKLDDFTILVNTTKDDETIDIETTGVTPLVGDFIILQESGHVSQFEIDGVTPIAGNQYTIDIAIPIDFPYTTDSVCKLEDVDMDKDGSLVQIDYMEGPIAGTNWHITRMIPSMVLSTAGDDGLFGNLTALTKGQYFRKENTVETENYFNIKENADFAVEGYDIRYPTRSGGQGSFGMTNRTTFTKNGAVIELKGSSGHVFRATTRDNMLALGKYRIKIHGHVTSEQ